MAASSEPIDPDLGRRHLPIWLFVVLAVLWVAIIKIVGQFTEDRADIVDGRILASDQVYWALVVPLGVATVFVYALITIFGMWRPFFHDPKPVRNWVWAVPIIFVVAIAAGINYSGLADRGAGFTMMLIAAAALVGFGEEGMFRCIGVTSLRQHGLPEGKVAFWSSVLFGLAHIGNIIGGDARAFGQAIIVAFAGYFFYLIRRVSRGNILNSILHGGFDFMIITSTQIIPEGQEANAAGAALAILVYVVIGILLLVRRHAIEPLPA